MSKYKNGSTVYIQEIKAYGMVKWHKSDLYLIELVREIGWSLEEVTTPKYALLKQNIKSIKKGKYYWWSSEDEMTFVVEDLNKYFCEILNSLDEGVNNLIVNNKNYHSDYYGKKGVSCLLGDTIERGKYLSIKIRSFIEDLNT